jgi:hypothetical protein
MSTAPQPEATGSRLSPWRLRAVRAIALCSMLAILVPWYAAIFGDFSRQDFVKLFIPILFFPLWLPYAWVFCGLRSAADAHTVKKALAVAVGCSSLIFLLCSFLLVVTPFDTDRQLAIAYALVALLQIALLVGAMTAYYSMKREPKDLQILVTRLWVPIVGSAAAAIVVPNIVLQERAPNEASSVGSLRNINVAQVYYAQTHTDNGFASSLAELGPEPGSALIDSVLTIGRKSGYVFVLTAASPDSHNRITHYTVIARPQRYGKEGKHSFLTDESGVFHFTTEDRAPTAQDPALQ